MGVKFRIWLFVLILKGQGSHCSIFNKGAVRYALGKLDLGAEEMQHQEGKY